MSEVIVAGGQGQAFAIESGQRFRVIDLEGKQVGDLVVFLGGDRTERLSPGNTRKLNGSLLLGVGSTLYSTKCRPLLRITADTVGIHDLLFSSCSPYDYPLRFAVQGHRSCLGILLECLAPFGIPEHLLPDPFNVFQRTAIGPDGSLETFEPLSRPGDFIEFEAAADCLVGISACPQDLNPCNGWQVTSLKLLLPEGS